METALIQYAAQWLTPLETGLFCAAGYVFFRKRGNTFAESCAYAIMTVMMVLSFLFQTALLTGLQHISTAAEIIAAAAILIIRYRTPISHSRNVLVTVFKQDRLFLFVFFLACLYLLFQALLTPPAQTHWEQLARIHAYSQMGGVLGHANSSGFQFPPNGMVLPYMTLRFDTGTGSCVFGFLAYLSILFSTYALARRYAWPGTALAVTLVVAGMTRIVLLATTPGHELIPAAAALFSLLAMNRTIERPNFQDFSMSLLGMAFALSDNIPSIIPPSIIFALSAILIIRRHGFEGFAFVVKQRKIQTLFLIIPLLVFLQIPVLLAGHPWPCLNADYTDNIYGLPGAFANMVKYLISSAHLTQPVEMFCLRAGHFSITRLLEQLCGLLAAPLGKSVGAVPFSIVWRPDETTAWFGPLAFLIILPAFILALVRGHRRIKAISVGLAGYIILISLLCSWSILNVRFFTIFFTCAGFCSAFLLPPWRLTAKGTAVLQTLSLILLLYAAFFNVSKPLIRLGGTAPRPPSGSPVLDFKQMILRGLRNGVWTTVGSNAGAIANDDMRFLDTIPSKAAVGVFGCSGAELYPYMMARPDLRFVRIDAESFNSSSAPVCDYFWNAASKTSPNEPPRPNSRKGDTANHPSLIRHPIQKNASPP